MNPYESPQAEKEKKSRVIVAEQIPVAREIKQADKNKINRNLAIYFIVVLTVYGLYEFYQWFTAT
jgi:hypothetical protein